MLFEIIFFVLLVILYILVIFLFKELKRLKLKIDKLSKDLNLLEKRQKFSGSSVDSILQLYYKYRDYIFYLIEKKWHKFTIHWKHTEIFDFLYICENIEKEKFKESYSRNIEDRDILRRFWKEYLDSIIDWKLDDDKIKKYFVTKGFSYDMVQRPYEIGSTIIYLYCLDVLSKDEIGDKLKIIKRKIKDDLVYWDYLRWIDKIYLQFLEDVFIKNKKRKCEDYLILNKEYLNKIFESRKVKFWEKDILSFTD